MAITKGNFKGKVEETEERGWSPGKGGYPDPGPDAQALMKGMVGAQAQESDAAQGLGPSTTDAPGDAGVPPRHNFSVPGGNGVIGGANTASTGAAGAVPKTAAGGSPSQTGAGQGKKIVKTYGPGARSYGGPQALTTPGGNLGRNTAQ